MIQLDYAQLYWDITKSTVSYKHGNKVNTCYPAMVIIQSNNQLILTYNL